MKYWLSAQEKVWLCELVVLTWPAVDQTKPKGYVGGSVVDYLTRDVGVQATLESLCCILKQDTLILAKYWFNSGRPENLLTGM